MACTAAFTGLVAAGRDGVRRGLAPGDVMPRRCVGDRSVTSWNSPSASISRFVGVFRARTGAVACAGLLIAARTGWQVMRRRWRARRAVRKFKSTGQPSSSARLTLIRTHTPYPPWPTSRCWRFRPTTAWNFTVRRCYRCTWLYSVAF